MEKTYSDLKSFLYNHRVSKELNEETTHTRIGYYPKTSDDTNEKIFGGNYHINKDELPIFYELYYDEVFVKKNKEYLTEIQNRDIGPILIDFDFKYDTDITTRQHTSQNISDIIQEYICQIQRMLLFHDGDTFPIYVLEKDDVNRLPNTTKDGIHMVIGINMERMMQIILREKVLKELPSILNNLKLKNSYDDVLDNTIVKGTTGWQMYGSRKPHHDSYKLVTKMSAVFSEETNDFEYIYDTKIKNKILIEKISAHCVYDTYEINPCFENEYKLRKQPLNFKKTSNKIKSTTSSTNEETSHTSNILINNDENVKLLFSKLKYNFNDMNNFYSKISNQEDLDEAISMIMDNLQTNEYSIRELHEYTQILPEKYYKSGSSHLLNRQVAFGLKHKDERLFLSWVKLRTKADDFDYNDIPNLYRQWSYFSKKENGITHKSIMYWAKQDAFEEYKKVKMNTIDSYIENTMFGAGDWDYATILHYMYKDKFICVNLKNGSTWYMFKNHRWEKDDGLTLRKYISTRLYQLYSDKQSQMLQEVQNFDPSDETHGNIQRKIKQLANICSKFKDSGHKNKIMREASELFFDSDFIKNMDSNPYLLCFENGVYDFKNKEFREGYPNDYITKTTGTSYIEYNENDTELSAVYSEIRDFMNKLFPEPDLCRYMWDHLASTLIGIKREQVFNIYKGSGSNGKSILTELMSLGLGDYKGTVPVNLITDKRSAIGGTTSEIIALKGVRYAVMQELTSGVTMNEGIMKEITSATEPLQGRALWCESETFVPQFSLVVCTNVLPKIKSNDDGTWRRMKVVNFMSKFISEGEIHYHENDYIYPKDKTLKEKLPMWAPIFIGMLVDIASKTDGEVMDCPQVIDSSNKYRENQDSFSKYVNTNIKKQDGSFIKKTELNNNFKMWYIENIGEGRVPKLQDLEDFMNKKFGPINSNGKWMNVSLIIHDDNDEIV